MATEFSRWSEAAWHADDKDWRRAEVITAGVDIGSVSSQAVILTDGELFAYSSVGTAATSRDSAAMAMNRALDGTAITFDDIRFIIGTGYGRVNVPFANKVLTEIACHARGANYLCGPQVRTLLDMGGQDCKAIRCDERGRAVEFLMNDKCAAGTGRGMEVLSELLSVDIEDIGPLSLEIENDVPPISNVCVVFAKSVSMALLRSGWSKNEVLAAYCEAMTTRVLNLLKRIGMEPEFAITGGIANNTGVVTRLEKKFGVKAIVPSPDPKIAGALGAALFAKDAWQKSLKTDQRTRTETSSETR
jgi:bzd-type benzoyl-CoA reductase Q subunit